MFTFFSLYLFFLEKIYVFIKISRCSSSENCSLARIWKPSRTAVMAGCAPGHPKSPEPLVNPLCESGGFGVCWAVGRRRRVGLSLRTCSTILDITSTVWATVLSLWAVPGQAPSPSSIPGAAGHGRSRGRPAPPGSCGSAPNSSRNPDRGINSAFVYKSVVLRRDEQLLSLT